MSFLDFFSLRNFENFIIVSTKRYSVFYKLKFRAARFALLRNGKVSFKELSTHVENLEQKIRYLKIPKTFPQQQEGLIEFDIAQMYGCPKL